MALETSFDFEADKRSVECPNCGKNSEFVKRSEVDDEYGCENCHIECKKCKATFDEDKIEWLNDQPLCPICDNLLNL